MISSINNSNINNYRQFIHFFITWLKNSSKDPSARDWKHEAKSPLRHWALVFAKYGSCSGPVPKPIQSSRFLPKKVNNVIKNVIWRLNNLILQNQSKLCFLTIKCGDWHIIGLCPNQASCAFFMYTRFQTTQIHDQAIFINKQLKEKSIEFNTPAYVCLIDLTRAFDRVRLSDIINILISKETPDTIVRAVRSLNMNNTTKVKAYSQKLYLLGSVFNNKWIFLKFSKCSQVNSKSWRSTTPTIIQK